MDTNNNFIGPINIGNPHEISMNKLASTILRLTNSKSQIIFKDLPEDDPKRRNPNINLAKNKLNWNPSYSLESGLSNTINYFKKLNEIPSIKFGCFVFSVVLTQRLFTLSSISLFNFNYYSIAVAILYPSDIYWYKSPDRSLTRPLLLKSPSLTIIIFSSGKEITNCPR